MDRGGLCKLTEDAYTFLGLLHGKELTELDQNFKATVLRVIEGDEDVLYVWSKITNEVEKEASAYLFNRIRPISYGAI